MALGFEQVVKEAVNMKMKKNTPLNRGGGLRVHLLTSYNVSLHIEQKLQMQKQEVKINHNLPQYAEY